MEASDPAPTAAERWEAVGRDLVLLRCRVERQHATDAIHKVEAALEDDRPVDATAVRDAREQLDQFRWFLETYLVPLADGDVEPWGEAPGSGRVPYRAYIEHLEDSGRYSVHRQPSEGVVDGA